MTGELVQRWVFPDDSRVWNAFGGITTILDNWDLLIAGAFGIKRISGALGCTDATFAFMRSV